MCCVLVGLCYFFFFKQKTAYEMRISDWSSDVCSSDLSSPRRDHRCRTLPRMFPMLDSKLHVRTAETDPLLGGLPGDRRCGSALMGIFTERHDPSALHGEREHHHRCTAGQVDLIELHRFVSVVAVDGVTFAGLRLACGRERPGMETTIAMFMGHCECWRPSGEIGRAHV